MHASATVHQGFLTTSLHCDGKDRVWPWWILIHECCPDWSAFLSHLHLQFEREAYLILHLFTAQELGEVHYTKLNQACQWFIIFAHGTFHLQVKCFLLKETQLSWCMYIVGPQFILHCSVLRQMLTECVKRKTHCIFYSNFSHMLMINSMRNNKYLSQ